MALVFVEGLFCKLYYYVKTHVLGFLRTWMFCSGSREDKNGVGDQVPGKISHETTVFRLVTPSRRLKTNWG
jgi:hypothetical protein